MDLCYLFEAAADTGAPSEFQYEWTLEDRETGTEKADFGDVEDPEMGATRILDYPDADDAEDRKNVWILYLGSYSYMRRPGRSRAKPPMPTTGILAIKLSKIMRVPGLQEYYEVLRNRLPDIWAQSTPRGRAIRVREIFQGFGGDEDFHELYRTYIWEAGRKKLNHQGITGWRQSDDNFTAMSFPDVVNAKRLRQQDTDDVAKGTPPDIVPQKREPGEVEEPPLPTPVDQEIVIPPKDERPAPEPGEGIPNRQEAEWQAQNQAAQQAAQQQATGKMSSPQRRAVSRVEPEESEPEEDEDELE